MNSQNDQQGTSQAPVGRRTFLRIGAVVLGFGCLAIPPIWRMLRRSKTPKVIAICQGPFPKGDRVSFSDVETVNSASEIVVPKSVRLIDRQTYCSSELVFRFVGEPQPAPDVEVSVAFIGRNGQVIHREKIVCSDGRSNAVPVYMFGRKLFGSPDNIENFRVPVDIAEVDKLKVQFERT